MPLVLGGCAGRDKSSPPPRPVMPEMFAVWGLRLSPLLGKGSAGLTGEHCCLSRGASWSSSVPVNRFHEEEERVGPGPGQNSNIPDGV